jgi:hypothetical protein
MLMAVTPAAVLAAEPAGLSPGAEPDSAQEPASEREPALALAR